MASHKFFSLIVPTALLLICINALSPKELQCSSQKVHLTIYYDTLSPSCEEFIVFELPKAFELDFMPIINLRLVPYGNGYIQEPNDTIICQVSFPTFLIFFPIMVSWHGASYVYTLQNGPAECYLNSIEACVINIWPDVVSISTSNGNLSEILLLFCNINKSWILFLFTLFPSITCNDMIQICQRTYHKSYTKSWNSENDMIANTVSNIWKTVDLFLLDLHHLFNCDAE